MASKEKVLAELKNTHVQWKKYSDDKKRAEEMLAGEHAVKKEQIKALRESMVNDTAVFKGQWRRRKDSLRSALESATLRAFEVGYTPNALLKELGSRDTMYFYNLRSSGKVSTMALPEAEVEPATSTNPILAGTVWEYSEHTGVHGVLRGDAGGGDTLWKFYDLTGEERWFIVDNTYAFVEGDVEFFDTYPKTEINRLSNMLEEILTGEYAGKLRLAANPYTN